MEGGQLQNPVCLQRDRVYELRIAVSSTGASESLGASELRTLFPFFEEIQGTRGSSQDRVQAFKEHVGRPYIHLESTALAKCLGLLLCLLLRILLGLVPIRENISVRVLDLGFPFLYWRWLGGFGCFGFLGFWPGSLLIFLVCCMT